MDSLYGINVKNKFELFYDEDVDPLEILAQQELAKKNDPDKKKDDKSKKNKNAKKPVLKTENKNKPADEIKPEKEDKIGNAPPKQNDKPKLPRPNREGREDNRPRRRDENANPENRDSRSQRANRPIDRPERSEGGFRTERTDNFERPEGTGFGHRENGPNVESRNENGLGQGRYRGRGRGRGAGRGVGGFAGRREFDRHSGSDRTGVKAFEKKEGSGTHNWGTMKDDLDQHPKVDYWRDPQEQMKETNEEPRESYAPAEDVENKDPNESTDVVPPAEETAEAEEPKQFSLEEWKKMEEAKRVKSDFKLRKANEGVDTSQWKSAKEYRKSEGDESGEEEDEEEEEEDDEDEAKHKRLVNEIRITFNDSPRRGRGGRRPRGSRGGRSNERGGDRRTDNRGSAPKFDDENDFPSLIKSVA